MKTQTKKKRQMSPEGRARIAAATRDRWAKKRNAMISPGLVHDLRAEKTVRQSIEALIEGLNRKEKPILDEIAQSEERLRLLRAEAERLGLQKEALTDTIKRLVEDEPAPARVATAE